MQRGSILGLALLSVVAPFSTTMLGAGMVIGSGTSPAPTDERVTVAVLVMELLSAILAVLGRRMLAPIWLRWLSGMLAGVGVLWSTYLRLSLIGLCGLQVFWTTCQP